MVKEIAEIKHIYKRIQKLHEKAWDQRNTQKKKREDPQYTREIVKEKIKSIQREDFSSLLFNLDQEIFQSLQEVLNQRSSSSQAFIQAFIHLEKIQKGFLHLSKVFLLLYSLI